MVQAHSRVALVTGAAHGIGFAIANRLASDGYAVALLDIDAKRCAAAAESIAHEHASLALPVVADTSVEEDVRKAVMRIGEKFGRLDAVVNNAGIPEPSAAPVHQLERAAWDRYLAVNLTGYFLVAKHTVPALQRNRGGIVNIASIHALQSDDQHNVAYAASKGGVVAMTHALALSLGPAIRVNCISPGWIDVRDPETRREHPLAEAEHAQHPVGRVGKPEDVATLAAFLLSSDAGYITGQNFVVDGGMTRKLAYR